jgi:hypothetical protein
MTIGGDGKFGWKTRPETKEKLRNLNIGKTHSEETKKKISEAKRGCFGTFTGKKHTEDSRKKMSDSHKGHIQTEETRKKISEYIKGKKWWNDGQINKRSVECPGKEWKYGRLPLKPYKKRKQNGL